MLVDYFVFVLMVILILSSCGFCALDLSWFLGRGYRLWVWELLWVRN